MNQRVSLQKGKHRHVSANTITKSRASSGSTFTLKSTGVDINRVRETDALNRRNIESRKNVGLFKRALNSTKDLYKWIRKKVRGDS